MFESAPLPSTSCSSLTSASSCRRNQGSIAVSALTWSTVMPTWNASITTQGRSGVGTRSSSSRSAAVRLSASAFVGIGWRPCSSERNAFWYASRKVRPMAITSPTLRIMVPSVRGLLGNFSKLNFGIFTTT